ncbi:MAG TPA: YiiX/YebB-like N1pC/P60 family cysteine hydrolase [Longimicrobiaceae bacterium]|nr:YiiX/YebB-like N1pC/P60 family cysteine hydrolase [Longimicrobiaceae bacterium]
MPTGILEKTLTVFGDIKVFRWPLFLLYDPGSYRVKGEAMREVMRVARPGDVLVRGYLSYLDGYFIPGYFSHVGLYLGEVAREHRPRCEDPVEEARVEAGFRTGEQMVIHSMAEGIFMEDLLNFCRCDYLAIMRFPALLSRAPAAAPLREAGRLSEPERALSGRLERGETVPFEEAWSCIREVALRQLGQPYDFRFNFNDFAQLSCSEFVYYCYRSLGWAVDVSPLEKRVFGLRRVVLEPDAFVSAPQLRLVWQSPSADPARVQALRAAASPAGEVALAGA